MASFHGPSILSMSGLGPGVARGIGESFGLFGLVAMALSLHRFPVGHALAFG